ncbi:hypothetical protein ACX9NE_28170 [Mycobacterium sp. ML4]
MNGEISEQLSRCYSAGPRALIVRVRLQRKPSLLEQIRETQAPTNNESDAIIDAPSDALIKTFGPYWVLNEYGLAIERAIDAYLEAWPIYG